MEIILKLGDETNSYLKALISQAVEESLKKNQLNQLLSEAEHSKEAAAVEKYGKWVGTEEAQEILGVRSKGKMQMLRDQSPDNGIILSKNGRVYRYLTKSLHDFLERNIVK